MVRLEDITKDQILKGLDSSGNAVVISAEMNQPLVPDSGEAMSWLETEYEMRESPAAKMRTFLLKEIKGEMPGLKFFEGDRPGSNLCYCTADDMETVWRVKKSLESSGFETTIKYFSW